MNWDDFVFVDPRATFAVDADEEPWYWEVLDEDPMDFCQPCEAGEVADTRDQEQIAADLFGHQGMGAPPWMPGESDLPTGYVPESCAPERSDCVLGPVLRIEPTRGTVYMGADDEGIGAMAPPTPITGHTPPPRRRRLGTMGRALAELGRMKA